MGDFLQTLRSLGAARLTIIGTVILTLIIFFIFLFTRLGTQDMSLLYSDLSLEDQNQIVRLLSQEDYKYSVEKSAGGDSDTSSIYVGADQVSALRMKLAENGLPSTGNIGYEIFDKSNALGQTTFQQNVTLVRSLEGELSRTLRTLDGIIAARVHLVLPRRQVFSRQEINPSASVTVKLMKHHILTETQVSAIRQLVASSVEELLPDRISIIDTKGNLLAAGKENNALSKVSRDLEKYRDELEDKLSSRIEDLLQNTVGYGKIRATVRLSMDHSKTDTTAENYNPDGQVARSTTTDAKKEKEDEKDAQSVSVQNQVPQQGGATTQNSPGTTSSNSTEDQTVTNYEISRTVTHKSQDPGTITRMTIGVLVDGTYTDKDGKQVYAKRPQAELDKIATLAKSAVGFDEKRGDIINVINMKFIIDKDLDIQPPKTIFMGLTKDELMRIAEIFVLAIVALLVVLLIVRPLITRIFETAPTITPPNRKDGDLLGTGDEHPALAGPVMDGDDDDSQSIEDLIDIDAVEGRVQASSAKKVAEIVLKHPEESLGIIRSWMYEDT